MIKHWIEAFRLRTLPLALASIGMGSFLAAANGTLVVSVLALTTLTTILLQILSNLANDYGDSMNGADSDDRKGPLRAVQSGKISPQAMRRAVLIFATLSLASGLLLLFIALDPNPTFWLFLGLGLLSIAAAVTYTAGKQPYGYAGFGDLSVFLFFGWLGVGGTYFLHTQTLDFSVFLPATTCSCFAVAVLNINNIRDIESDRKAGKFTIPVRLGRSRAVWYHWALLAVGVATAAFYVLLHYRTPYQWLFLLVLPLLFFNGQAVAQKSEPSELDPFLKQMALTALLFAVVFGVGQVLG